MKRKTKKFDNVKDDDWYKEAVDFVTSREIFSGMGDGNFEAKGNATRGQVASILMRFMKK